VTPTDDVKRLEQEHYGNTEFDGLFSNDTGNNNAASGVGALRSNTSDGNNVTNGYEVLPPLRDS
jgi:hypothetical protein